MCKILGYFVMAISHMLKRRDLTHPLLLLLIYVLSVTKCSNAPRVYHSQHRITRPRKSKQKSLQACLNHDPTYCSSNISVPYFDLELLLEYALRASFPVLSACCLFQRRLLYPGQELRFHALTRRFCVEST